MRVHTAVMQIEVTTGPELRELREAAGLTQAQVATLIGSGQHYISVIESKVLVKKATADRYRAAVQALSHTQTSQSA